MAAGNVPGASIAWLFFGLSGRIGRKAYILAGLFMIIIQAFTLYRFALEPEGSAAGATWAMLFMIVGIVAIWSTIALSVKRLHDFDKPGLLAVCLLIPAVSIIAFLVLCFWPGDAGANQYGSHSNRPKD